MGRHSGADDAAVVGDDAVSPVVAQFMDENGRIVIQPNFFKYVVAVV